MKELMAKITPGMKWGALRTQAGFTMIELLVVATIIIVLSTIGLVSYRNAGINARDAKRQADLQMVRQALVLYRTENGSYPVTEPGSVSGNLATIDGLADFLGTEIVQDPKDPEPPHIYNYSSDGRTFILTAFLEKDPLAPFQLVNP